MEVDLFKAGATKSCVFGGCNSDSRRHSTKFISFPKPCFGVRKWMVNGDESHIKHCCVCAETKLWLTKCRREKFSELAHIKKWHYICVLHFINETGPTKENPFPLPVSEASLHRDVNKLASENRKLKEDYQNLKEENRELKKQNKRLKEENKILKESGKLKETKRKFNSNLDSASYENATTFVDSLKRSDKKCKFYTGLTHENILALFSFLSPVDELRCWNAEPTQTCDLGQNKLGHFEDLILVLIRLRTGLLEEDMKYRFSLPTGYISEIVTNWIQHCYSKFDLMRPFMFPTRDKMKETSPAAFEELKNTRVIIDCAEFYCESSSDSGRQQNNPFSSNKASNTFKVLLGCTPNGAISFVSEVFEASISDEELVQQSKLLDLLDDGDLVLADRGSSKARNVHLNISPFLKGRDASTVDEEIATKRIAERQICIQHVVAKIKQFRLLKKRLSGSMSGMLPQLVFVCACLVNFQEPIVESWL